MMICNGLSKIFFLFSFLSVLGSEYRKMVSKLWRRGGWPYEILYYLKSRAIIAQWGGDVYNKNTKGVEPHTTTVMGSGDFASGLWGSACFIQNIYVLDTSLKLFYPEWVYVNSEEPMCYSVRNFQAPVSMPTFYFGGPGRNQNCP